MDFYEQFYENFQNSWDTHMAAFGPILAPAFKDNFEAKIHLTAALNNISRREFEKCFIKLNILKDMCSSDEDCAAWFFCMGLAFEFSGMKDEMLRYYNECVKYEPSFSLPYLMIAKCSHAEGNPAFAEKYYEKAVHFLEEEHLPTQTPRIISSVYVNYFSCLTSIGKYSEAETYLKESEEIFQDFPERLHYAAILYAYMGNNKKYNEYMLLLEKENPNLYKTTKKLIEELQSQ